MSWSSRASEPLVRGGVPAAISAALKMDCEICGTRASLDPGQMQLGFCLNCGTFACSTCLTDGQALCINCLHGPAATAHYSRRFRGLDGALRSVALHRAVVYELNLLGSDVNAPTGTKPHDSKRQAVQLAAGLAMLEIRARATDTAARAALSRTRATSRARAAEVLELLDRSNREYRAGLSAFAWRSRLVFVGGRQNLARPIARSTKNGAPVRLLRPAEVEAMLQAGLETSRRGRAAGPRQAVGKPPVSSESGTLERIWRKFTLPTRSQRS
jgi:hypothetical protein